MTDKEIAEKSFFNHELGYKLATDERSYIEGFIEGLKVGKPKWHNLQEDPNDLPKEFDSIRKAFGVYPEEKSPHVVMNQDGEFVYCIRNVNNKQKSWYWAYADDNLGSASEPIAWCEIPKFKHKESEQFLEEIEA